MNYNSLINKPTLNHKELIGDNKAADVGGMTEESMQELLATDLTPYYTKAEIDELFARSYVYREKSGSIVTFECPSTAQSIPEVTSEIVAVQSGTGDPSPTNIRPITGFSAVNVTRAGKNLLDVTKLAKGSVTVSSGEVIGTSTAFVSAWGSSVNGFGEVLGFKFPYDGQLTISLDEYTDGAAGTTGTGLRLYVLYSDGTNNIINMANEDTTTTHKELVTTAGKIITMIYFSYGSLANTWHLTNFQIEKGDTANTYEAFSGTTYTTTLKDGNDQSLTCYGGQLTNENGVQTLADTGVNYTLNSVDGLVPGETPDKNYFYKTIGNYGYVDTTKTIMCDKFPAVAVSSSNTLVGINVINSSAYNEARITFRPENVASYDTTSINTWLASNPLQIKFELTTPIEITQDSLTISSAAGTNNIWCDSGDITVKALDKIIQE